MPATRGKFSKLLAPGLAYIYFRNLKDRPEEWSKWCPRKGSKRAYEEQYNLTGLGQFVYKAEGAAYAFDEPIPGNTIRFTHLTYALGFRVTKEMMEDDLYAIMNRMSKELSRSAALNKEVQAFSILNNAFSSSFSGYDSAALCSATHTLLNGDTLSNLATGDFSYSALQTALELFEAFTDDRGYKVIVQPSMVIHSPGDMWNVNTVLKTVGKPGTADNDNNTITSMFNLVPQLVHYLTDSDAWFVTASKSDIDSGDGARMYIRVDDQFASDDDPNTGDAIFTGRHRVSTGFGDWRWLVGSAGV